MDFTKVIKERRSVRKYDTSKPVPADVLERILDAARSAPSACNFQPWHFVVLKDPKVIQRIEEVYLQDWDHAAPVVIVACCDPTKAWVRPDGLDYSLGDLSIAMTHLILAAHNEGLGTCWIGMFDEVKVKKILGIPGPVRVYAMTPLGYSLEKPRVTGRKALSEIVHYNKW